MQFQKCSCSLVRYDYSSIRDAPHKMIFYCVRLSFVPCVCVWSHSLYWSEMKMCWRLWVFLIQNRLILKHNISKKDMLLSSIGEERKSLKPRLIWLTPKPRRHKKKIPNYFKTFVSTSHRQITLSNSKQRWRK